jgi:hypothetical protein
VLAERGCAPRSQRLVRAGSHQCRMRTSSRTAVASARCPVGGSWCART